MSTPGTSSPATAVSSEQPTSPMTPSPSVRTRFSNNISQNSPTTSTDPSQPLSASQLNDLPRSTFRSIFTPFARAPGRHIARADPSLLTCFDPQDKELYELWAPQH